MEKAVITLAITLVSLAFILSGCATGKATRCVPQPYECSDCIDNDGDGKIDYKVNKRGVVTGDSDCASATDICERVASAEVCDNKDNDCDGSIDEGLGSTTCGIGACQRTVQNCVNGQLQNCTSGTPSTEICDGIDNDCDGSIDEGLGSTTCGTGICRRTVQNCVNGQLQTCVPGTPSTEVCDNLDNDCDGSIDEGGVCGNQTGNQTG